MKFEAEKKELLRALSRASSVAAKRDNALPILSHALIEADKKELRITATDLILTVFSRANITTEKKGAACVQVSELLERVKVMPDGVVRLSAKDGRLTIQSHDGARKHTISIEEPEDFPKIKSERGDETEVPLADLLTALHRTHYAISTDETRLHLASLLFNFGDGALQCVATDGHRLSEVSLGEREITSNDKSILIPSKGVHELRKIASEAFKNHGGDFKIGVSLSDDESLVFFMVDETLLSVKLVDGQYVPWQQVVPKRDQVAIRVARNAFAQSLRSALLASSDKNGAVNISVDHELRVSAENDGASAEDVVQIEYGGPSTKIKLNAKYVLESLDSMACDAVSLSIVGPGEPMTIRPEGGAGLCVTMPLRA